MDLHEAVALESIPAVKIRKKEQKLEDRNFPPAADASGGEEEQTADGERNERMKITTIACVYISSYQISLKIKELLPSKRAMREVDRVTSRLNLGRDVYEKEKIDYEKVDDLCEILNQYRKIGESYDCSEFLVYAGSTLKNAQNMIFVLEQVRIRTGIEIRVLSNSEQRAMDYQTISALPEFPEIIQEGCTLVQVGGSSLQVTIFDKGHMRFTQQIVLGSLRLLRTLARTRAGEENKERQILEMVEKEMNTFRGNYGGSKKNRHVILMGEYLDGLFEDQLQSSADLGFKACTDKKQVMETGEFLDDLRGIYQSDLDELSGRFDFLNINNPILYPSLVLYYGLLKELNADYVWIPGCEVTDGIAYHYALEKKVLRPAHDFDDDVLSCADEIAERYNCHRPHIDAMEKSALAIFDATKKINGMTKRDRLLLQTAVRLHDCGKYICMANHAEMSFHIIMSSEILGLTHRERQVIAYAVKFNKMPLAPFEDLRDIVTMEEYVLISKLAAILRLSNSLDRSHKQKFHECKVARKDKDLVITVSVSQNSAWEQEKFEQQSDLFRRVFSLRPVLREKKKPGSR